VAPRRARAAALHSPEQHEVDGLKSGAFLLLTAVLAVVWASSSSSATYLALRHHVGFVVDDVLMAVFFFLAGLEIKKEVHDGSLSTARLALLPIAAALGGMAVPALVYVAFHGGSSAARGWGIPMATDIAFAMGVVALLGKRLPREVRILLLALAVVDDVGAIVVIAFFYASTVSIAGLALATIGIGGVLVLRDVAPRHPVVYLLPGLLIWYGALTAGIHPTIAGVALGLLVPAVFDRSDGRRMSSPAIRIEARLQPVVTWVIMPVFALTNAGVDVRGITLSEPTSARVLVAIVLALVLGKPVGIALGTWVGVRLGGHLPRTVTWGAVTVVGAAGGIGFTMAIFISGLAFGTGPLLGPAKLGVLVASVISAVCACGLGLTLLPKRAPAPS
jgi:NhaA family Na+:H+ antiporter